MVALGCVVFAAASSIFVLAIVSEAITLSFAILPLMDLIWEKISMPFQYIFSADGIVLSVLMLAWLPRHRSARYFQAEPHLGEAPTPQFEFSPIPDVVPA